MKSHLPELLLGALVAVCQALDAYFRYRTIKALVESAKPDQSPNAQLNVSNDADLSAK